MKNTEEAKDIENYIQSIDMEMQNKFKVHYQAYLSDINLKDFIEFAKELPEFYKEYDGDGDYFDEEMNLSIALREFLATNLDIARLKAFMGESEQILLEDAMWKGEQLNIDVWYTTHNKDIPF